MSTINKLPYINNVLSDLPEEDVSHLLNLINGVNPTDTHFYTLDTIVEKGIFRGTLETDREIFTGYLIYTSNQCTFIAYGHTQQLNILDLDLENKKFKLVDEYLDIDELRTVIATFPGGGGGGEGLSILELSNLSGTLTDEEYATALKDSCIIKIGTQYYYKELDSVDYIVFKAPLRNTNNSNILESVTITKADKTYAYNSEIIATCLTQQEYDDLETKEANTYYFIIEE